MHDPFDDHISGIFSFQVVLFALLSNFICSVRYFVLEIPLTKLDFIVADTKRSIRINQDNEDHLEGITIGDDYSYDENRDGEGTDKTVALNSIYP